MDDIKFTISEAPLHEPFGFDEHDYLLLVRKGSPHQIFNYLRPIVSSLEVHRIVHYRYNGNWSTVIDFGNEKALITNNKGFSSGYQGGGSKNFVDLIKTSLKDATNRDVQMLESVIYNKEYDNSAITIDIFN